MGICCSKCSKGKRHNSSLNTNNRFGAYRDEESGSSLVSSHGQYRDKYYDDDEDEGDDSANVNGEDEESNNMLSERQIRDLVQKQLRALHELDEKLNDENQDEDELEEEAFLDEVRRSSPQSRKPKVDDPAKALLDLETATNTALNSLENENYDDEFNKFMSQMDSDDDPEADFDEGDNWLR
jgi:hypothetical protein